MPLLDRLGQDKPAVKSEDGGKGVPGKKEEKKQAVDPFADLKQKIQQRLIDEMEDELSADLVKDKSRRMELEGKFEEVITKMLLEEDVILAKTERQKIIQEIKDEVLGYGPIEPLLRDDDVSEVMINHAKQVYCEKKGKLILSDVVFRDDEHVMRVIEKIITPLGRRCDESTPYVDARLPDGSRVNAIIPPLALKGPCVTIRKFKKDPLTVDDLIRFGSLSREMADFLKACVLARLNLVVSGGTGSGKTTTLNVISSFIPDDERIITCEDAAEIQLRQEHVVTLESRPPNIEGKGAVTIRDLVRNCLRMRPERIVVGECRGGEALDMLQAMNTGHDGSMTTVHSNDPRDSISRLETLVMMAGMNLPQRAIREQISRAVNIIVQQSRLKDGSRRITYITEVQGMEGETVTLSDIFLFEQTGMDEKGKIMGKLRATGIRPKFAEKFESMGIHMAADIFMPK